MDFENKDLQTQKFQLASEDSTKFPPGLRSYTLPKFDLDDSLSVHLRFDSLVETEALFGIQTQEENRWIQEFSRGSSEMEFSSSAAESCSISRCNNVWSEVTSSESVEMLLKSVGQGEMITRQGKIEESDACNELVTSTNLMEPNLDQVGFAPSKIAYALDADPALPPDICVKSLSGIKRDEGAELPQLEVTSHTQGGGKSRHGISRDLDSVSDNCGLSVTLENLPVDGKGYDAAKGEDCLPVHESVDNMTLDYSTTSDMQFNHLITSVQNVIGNAGDSGNQEAPQQQIVISNENPDGSLKDDVVKMVEDQVFCKDAEMCDQCFVGNEADISGNNVNNRLSLNVDSTVLIPEGNAIETSICDGENPSNLALVNSPVQIECSEDARSENSVQVSECESLAPYNYTEGFIGNAHEASPALVEGGNNSKGQIVEVSNGIAEPRKCGEDSCFGNTVQVSKCEGLVPYKDTEMGVQLVENAHEISKCEGLVPSKDTEMGEQLMENAHKVSKCEGLIPSKDTEMGEQFIGNAHEVSKRIGLVLSNDTKQLIGNSHDALPVVEEVGYNSEGKFFEVRNDIVESRKCSEDACSDYPVQVSKCEGLVPSKDTEMGEQLIGKAHDVSKCEVLVPLKDTEMGEQLIGNGHEVSNYKGLVSSDDTIPLMGREHDASPVVVEGGDNSEGKLFEVSNGIAEHRECIEDAYPETPILVCKCEGLVPSKYTEMGEHAHEVGKREGLVPPKDTEMGEQLIGNGHEVSKCKGLVLSNDTKQLVGNAHEASPVMVEGGNSSEGHIIEFSNGIAEPRKCSEDACSENSVQVRECEGMVPSKETELGEELIGNAHEVSKREGLVPSKASPVVVEGGNSSEEHIVEFCNGNTEPRKGSEDACSENSVQVSGCEGMVPYKVTEMGEELLGNAHEVSKCEGLVASKDSEMGEQLIGNPHEASTCGDLAMSKNTKQLIGNAHEASHVVVEGGNNSEGLVVEVSNSIVEPSNVSSFEKHDHLLEGSCCQVESGISVRNSLSSLLMVEDFKGHCDRSSNNGVGSFSSLTVEVHSSANRFCEAEITGNIKDGCRGSRVQEVEFRAEDHIFSSVQVEFADVCETNLVNRHSDIHCPHLDVSVFEKCKAAVSTDSSNMDSITDDYFMMEKRVASSPIRQCNMKIVVEAHGSPSGQIIGNEPAPTKFISEDTNSTCCRISDDVPLLSRNGNATEVSEHKEDGNLPSCVGDFTDLDKKEETITEISLGPSLLIPNGCSQLASEPVLVSASEQGSFCVSAGKLLHEAVSLSLSSVEMDSFTCESDPQDKVTREYSELENCPVHNDSCTTENDCAGVVGVSHEKSEGASLKVAGTISSNVEMLTLPVPSSLLECSNDAGQNNHEYDDANLVSEDNNSGQVVLTSTEDAVYFIDSSSNPSEHLTKIHAQEVGSRNPKCEPHCDALEVGSWCIHSDELCSEPSCGSPAVVLSRSEKENREGGSAPLSDDTDGVTNKVGSIIQDPNGNKVSEDDKSFTFDVSLSADMSAREIANGWKPFNCVQPCECPQAVECSQSTTSGLCKMDPKLSQEISHRSPQTPQASDRDNVRGSSDFSPVCRASDRGTNEEGKPQKETISVRKPTKRGSKSFGAAPYSVGTKRQAVPAENSEPFGHIDDNSTKSCGVPTVQAFNFLDLNTSASPTVLLQQPFTDSQQVQLRAQIFVYGFLIQGTAPDEMCMTLAFGESDGGRNAWEHVWRVAVEMLHNQKSSFTGPVTPLQSRSGAGVPEQVTTQNALQSKAFSMPTGQIISKSAHLANINPGIPISSPLWSIPIPSLHGSWSSSMPRGHSLDSDPTISPLQPYQYPHKMNHMEHNTSWPRQAPLQGSWAYSPQTSVDAVSYYSALPITETVNGASVRESFVPRPSVMRHPSPLIHDGISITSVSPAKHVSADSNPRKRKKSSTYEEFGQICLLAQTHGEAVSCSSIAFTDPRSSPSKPSGSFITETTPTYFTPNRIIGGQDAELRVIFPEETCSKIEQAKLQAEDAAAFAAAAVSHSRGIWDQLANQKNSGLVPEAEGKLAYAALAVAAAASVAKAAAAAAKVAADAALQAKLMVDEALVSGGIENPMQCNETCLFDGANNMERVTPASISKGNDKVNNSSSIVVTAKEATRRFEAVSTTTKQAENLDAVVKAAELAAEAVSQAGAIIAMGDQVPFRVAQLVESGPEGYRKVGSKPFGNTNDISREQSFIDNFEVSPDISAEHFNEQPSNTKEVHITYQEQPYPKEMSQQLTENQMGWLNGMHKDSVTRIKKGLEGHKGWKEFDLAKTIGVVPASEIGPKSTFTNTKNEEYGEHQPVVISKENSIREGSFVEVLSYVDGLGRVWLTAKVLNLKDGKAYVSYTERPPDEGSRQLKEWLALESRGDNAPRIRIARPCARMKYEGTQKRGRAAIRDYAWSVGDRVDAWIHDSWREGIITEKSKGDEGTFTVHFPVQGDTSIVRAWHLRSSLVWKDGQWTEWSSSMENNPSSHEGDTPQEKRLKLSSHRVEIVPSVEISGKDRILTTIGIEEFGKPEVRSLALSANEKELNVGTNMRGANKSDALRMKHTGSQKEGPRVKFGVPKPEPGKKQKFMEVSKHFVGDRSGKMNEGNVSGKFSRYLIPKGSGSHALKKTVGFKEKRPAEFKPKVLKSGKSHGVPSRSIPKKNNSLTASDDCTVQDHLLDVNVSPSHDGSMSGKQNLIGPGYLVNTQKTSESPILFSSLALPSDATSFKKSSSAVEADRNCKGKLAHPGEKLGRNEEKDPGHNDNDNPGKSIPNVAEPRRSTRRIQPTSRLLEGLQSSFISSKIPAASHDKDSKVQHRGASSSRGNTHS